MVIFDTQTIEDIKKDTYDKSTIKNIFAKILSNKYRTKDEVQELEKSILSDVLQDIPSNLIAITTAGLYDDKNFKMHGSMIDYREEYGKIGIHLNIDDVLENENFSDVLGSIAGIGHEVQHFRQLQVVESGRQDIPTLLASLEIYIMFHKEQFSDYYLNNWNKFFIEKNADRIALVFSQKYIKKYLDKTLTLEEIQKMISRTRYTTIYGSDMSTEDIINRLVELLNKIKEYKYIMFDPFYTQFHLDNIMDLNGNLYPSSYFKNQLDKTGAAYFAVLYEVSSRLENNKQIKGTI